MLCKSIGALLLLAVGILVLQVARRTKSNLVVWALILVPPLYMAARAPGAWSGESLVELARSYINAERAESLEFRLINEDMLAAKALQRPMFGWGGWGRNRVFDEQGRDISVTDGMWIIALGTNGLVGLASLTLVFLLPVALLLRRCPAGSWGDPEVAPAAGLAVLMGLCLIDYLSNALINPIYMLAAGSLMGLRRAQGPQSAMGAAGRDEAIEEGDRLAALGRHREAAAAYARAVERMEDRADDPAGPRDLAPALERLGLALADLGRPAEAERAWSRALALHDADADAQGRRADLRNDLAWLLAADPASTAHDPARAVDLATAAVAADPGRATCWNTLGMAQHRAGDPAAAIRSLRRSEALSGGSGYDDLLLALAHARLGDGDRARAHLDRADAWIAAHAPGHPGLARLRAEVEAACPPGIPSAGTGPRARGAIDAEPPNFP